MQTPILKLARVVSARGLATNLFAHPLERLSVADLKQEAKRRGLSISGNKATLISRIQHVAKRTSDSTANDGSDRGLATTATAVASPKSPRPTLDVKLPDLSLPQDTEGPHIPFLPDFWDSSRVRAPDAIHHSPAADSPLPKVLVVAGTRASSPTYNVSHHSESESDDYAHEADATSSGSTGFWGDVATDLGLPQASDVSAALKKGRDTVLSIGQDTTVQEQTESHSSVSLRPLDIDETRGLWIMLAILGGSWVVGGFYGSSKKKKPTAGS